MGDVPKVYQCEYCGCLCDSEGQTDRVVSELEYEVVKVLVEDGDLEIVGIGCIDCIMREEATMEMDRLQAEYEKERESRALQEGQEDWGL